MDNFPLWADALFWAAVAGMAVYSLFNVDWFWLGYGVVGNSIQVRLLHLIPVWGISIANIQSLEIQTAGNLPSNDFTRIFFWEWQRPYVHIRLRRGLFRSFTITPFRAVRFVAEVRRRMS